MAGVVVLLLSFVAYALLARRLDRWSISAPMVFVAAGLLLGPYGSGLLDLEGDSETVLTFTELTLAVLLFSDATSVPFASFRRDAGVPGRLLSIGLLLTLVAGTILGLILVPEFGLAGAALIAAILAPTDAALGMAVVTDRAVPVRIRRALNIESGLNDGIATPFVLLFLAAFVSEESGGDNSWLLDAIVEIGLALVVAAVVGGIGGRIMSWAAKCRWVTETSQQLYALALALSAYEISIWVGGNGFVAAFSAGLAFGATAPKQLGSVRFGEDAALFASFLVWVVFGGWMVGPVLAGGFDADAAIYAVFSLTVVRMLPVAIALAGKGFRSATVAFMGWFGPRGLASVVFSLIALEELAGSPDDVALLEIAAWTVFLSVLAHGVSARPLAATYGRRIRSGDPEAPELVDVPEPRLRRHLDLPDRRSAAEESQAA